MNRKDFEPTIDEEQKLVASLHALAGADRNKQAPPQQEALLLEEFRRHSPALAPKRAGLSWRFALGLAAAILIVAALGSRLLHHRVPTPPQVVAIPQVAKAPEPPAIPEPPPARRRLAARAASQTHEIATDFLPLTYGDSLTPLEGGQVVRIRLSRSALRSVGLPLNEERAAERIQADVLLGQDGVARAIRFVR